MGAVNRCYTAPVNVIKFKINYSPFFRDMEKIKYVLNVCHLDGVLEKSKYTFNINHNWKVKFYQFPMQLGFVIDHKWTIAGSLIGAIC